MELNVSLAFTLIATEVQGEDPVIEETELCEVDIAVLNAHWGVWSQLFKALGVKAPLDLLHLLLVLCLRHLLVNAVQNLLGSAGRLCDLVVLVPVLVLITVLLNLGQE